MNAPNNIARAAAESAGQVTTQAANQAAADEQTLFFRPPSEAGSFIIQTTVGCAHNKCSFCNMYKRTRFRVLHVDDIIAGINADATDLGHLTAAVKSVFFSDGSAIIMPSDQLIRVMEHARTCFPKLERFACYGAASHINLKTPQDLAIMRGLGLRRIHCGIESGNDDVLTLLNKGSTRADILRAGELLFDAGIELDASIMIGAGGVALSQRNAEDTASVLNACKPATLRIRTFAPKAGTPLADDCLAGKFDLPGPHAALRELRCLIEQLDCAVELRSDHWTNFIRIFGKLPAVREKALAAIDGALEQPEHIFRQVGVVQEGNF